MTPRSLTALLVCLPVAAVSCMGGVEEDSLGRAAPAPQGGDPPLTGLGLPDAVGPKPDVSSQPEDAGAIGPACGPLGTDDCSTSLLVPGGTFKRNYDGVPTVTGGYGPHTLNPKYEAAISDFRLDKYEITVGRFRAFVAGYPGNLPREGDGKNPNNPADPGWSGSWNYHLQTRAELLNDLSSTAAAGGRYVSWTDALSENENRAMNWLSWYLAYAFCIWDGGRLPTEAEWNYAASGGNEQRVYPWSVPPTSTVIDSSYAVYGGKAGGLPVMTVARGGSRSPKGDGRWGHADLSGNLAEWVVDDSPNNEEDDVPLLPCVNCARFPPRGFTWVGSYRAVRSASFAAMEYPPNAFPVPPYDAWLDPAPQRVATQSGSEPHPGVRVGARCARSP